MQSLIVNELRPLGAEMVEENFTGRTPRGPLPMKNIIAKFAGGSGRIVVISGHYDTLQRPGLRFIGANDGGSSTGFLLTLAQLVSKRARKDDVWLVFFDGEEALVRWSDEDHTYGSRHQAARWQADGTLRRIKALINVDMIGDADLRLLTEQYSTAWLRQLIWRKAEQLGYAAQFPSDQPGYIEDDHIPFVNGGVSAVDLIDFEYGPRNRYWHTEQDTMDKLSARSFAIVLHVVDEVLSELEMMP